MDSAILVLFAGPVGVSVALSIWGAVRVPPDARFRARFGGLGFDFWIPKAAALVLWPLMTAMVALGAALIASRGPGASVALLLGLAAAAIILVGQAAATRSAAR